MRIAFTGAHSTGKTTLINILKQNPDFVDYTFIHSPTRSIQVNGNQINEKGDDTTQNLIMFQHVMNSNTSAKKVVFDRCSLDGFVYTSYLYANGKVSKETLKISECICLNTISKYDCIFYLPIDIELNNDGVRSQDPDFQLKIGKLFEEYRATYKIPVIPIVGTVEERIEKIYNAIVQFTVFKEAIEEPTI